MSTDFSNICMALRTTDSVTTRAFTIILEKSRTNFVIWLIIFMTRMFRPWSSKIALLEEAASYLGVNLVEHPIILPNPQQWKRKRVHRTSPYLCRRPHVAHAPQVL
jgi:hypothetical protein